MSTSETRWRSARVLLLAIAALGGRVPEALATTLAAGAPLPPLEGTTLNGEPATLPRDAQGRPALIIIGVSKAAAGDARPWLQRCLTFVASPEAAALDLRCYDVRMVEDIPRLFRGMTEKGMRSGYPAELRARALLIYRDNAAWREHLGVADDKTAYVVAVDTEGRVRTLVKGPLSSADFDKIVKAWIQ